MTALSWTIVVLWDAALIAALWHIASQLHERVHIGLTPAAQVARHWCMGMGLFVALLSSWPQSVIIAAVSLSVYVTWGAILATPRRRRRLPCADAGPPHTMPPQRWPHVAGGLSHRAHADD